MCVPMSIYVCVSVCETGVCDMHDVLCFLSSSFLLKKLEFSKGYQVA